MIKPNNNFLSLFIEFSFLKQNYVCYTHTFSGWIDLHHVAKGNRDMILLAQFFLIAHDGIINKKSSELKLLIIHVFHLV